MVKGRKNRPRPSLTELCRRRNQEIVPAMRVCQVVTACRLSYKPSRPSNQARPAAAPCTRPQLRSYIGKSKSNLKLKRWIAVTKCTSLKSQGKAAICSTDTHYITTKKKSEFKSSKFSYNFISTHLFPLVWNCHYNWGSTQAQHQFPFFVKSVKVKIIEVVGNK